jgi:hypothetical protein
MLPVVDTNVWIPFSLIWKKGDSSLLLQKFVAQVEAKRLAKRQEADVNRRFSIFNCLIFDSSVEGGMPSAAAAPPGPATFPPLFASAASIISFS